MICGSGGSKSRIAKAAGAEPAGQMRDEKLHAVVARSTFPSRSVQNTPGSDHFWKLRCRKSVRHCGAKHAKHISKSKCAKHTRFGPLLEVLVSKKCTPLWREAHFEVKMYKTLQLRNTFRSCAVEKVYAVVARSTRSTFPSRSVQNTPGSDHFWKFWCLKSARRCGAKHISKSKCTKHFSFGTLLEVALSKKFTPLWREAHFQVKMYKTHQDRTTFGSWDVEKVHAVVVRSTFPSQNVQNAPGVRTTSAGSDVVSRGSGPCQKWAKREVFVAFSTTTTTTPHYTPIHYTTTTPSLHSTSLHYTPLHYNYTQLLSITLHHTTLHSTALHYTQLHLRYITLHDTTLHYIPLHYINLHYTTLHSTILHYITLHYIPLHYTTPHYTTLRYIYITLHYTTLHYIPLHYTTPQYTTLQLHLHYIPLHYTPLHSTTLHYRDSRFDGTHETMHLCHPRSVIHTSHRKRWCMMVF